MMEDVSVSERKRDDEVVEMRSVACVEPTGSLHVLDLSQMELIIWQTTEKFLFQLLLYLDDAD